MYDSLHDDVSVDTVNQICSIVRSKRSKIKIEVMDVCKQHGVVDCGLYALANATALCQGELPQSMEYIQGEMRQHLTNCIEQSCPCAFPSVCRDTFCDSLKSKSVSIHCSCRLPADKRMIQCCKCEDWYHEDCEVVEDRAWNEEDYPWLCKKCKRMHSS